MKGPRARRALGCTDTPEVEVGPWAQGDSGLRQGAPPTPIPVNLDEGESRTAPSASRSQVTDTHVLLHISKRIK